MKFVVVLNKVRLTRFAWSFKTRFFTQATNPDRGWYFQLRPAAALTASLELV
jgi:hypothetical protein